MVTAAPFLASNAPPPQARINPSSATPTVPSSQRRVGHGGLSEGRSAIPAASQPGRQQSVHRFPIGMSGSFAKSLSQLPQPGGRMAERANRRLGPTVRDDSRRRWAVFFLLGQKLSLVCRQSNQCRRHGWQTFTCLRTIAAWLSSSSPKSKAVKSRSAGCRTGSELIWSILPFKFPGVSANAESR